MSIVLLAQRAAHATAYVLAQAFTEDHLTPSEVNALANLADGSARTVSQLAVAAGVRPTTLSSLLDRLETRGLLTRRPQPGDRRALLVELTPEGRRLARRVAAAVSELEDRALADLTDAEGSTVRSALVALALDAS